LNRETGTRYLIVTHVAATRSRMHRLLGMTMVEKDVSRLVGVDLGRGIVGGGAGRSMPSGQFSVHFAGVPQGCSPLVASGRRHKSEGSASGGI